jgi:hypothetical protein
MDVVGKLEILETVQHLSLDEQRAYFEALLKTLTVDEIEKGIWEALSFGEIKSLRRRIRDDE